MPITFFYIIGLLILEKIPTMERISWCLRNCYHDELFRMLCGMNLTMAAISKILIYFIEKHRRAKVKSWLIVDDTSILKRFARNISLACYAFCGCVGCVANGIHFVAQHRTDGQWSFPVGFRMWISKKDSKGEKRENYKTKVDLARELIVDNIDFYKTCEYITRNF